MGNVFCSQFYASETLFLMMNIKYWVVVVVVVVAGQAIGPISSN